MRIVVLALLGLLLMPVGSAQEVGIDVRNYRAFVHTEQGSNGVVAETNITVPAVHSWESQGGQSVLEVRAAYVTQSGGVVSPNADYRVVWNGAVVEDCGWHVEGGTVSGANGNPTISLYCLLPEFVIPGNYTVEVERTSVTGTPVVNSVTSIVLIQTESVNMDINIVNLETWIPIVFWLLLLGLAFWFGWTWTAAFSIPGLLLALFPSQVPGSFEQYLLLAVLGLALEYFTGRREKRSEELEV